MEYAQQRVRDAKSKKSLRIVLAEVEHLRRLSDDLLLIAKLDSSQARLALQRIGLNEVVSDCVGKMRPFAKQRSVSLRFENSPQVYLVADGEKIRSVVLNLLDNAIRYSGPKSSVRAAICQQNDSVIITVADNGVGISSDELPYIFDRFHQGPSARAGHSGNGLGLSIVRKIVELHGGTIKVQSEKGNGSTFIISLPLQPGTTT
jgi:signal transduction histidine kinase